MNNIDYDSDDITCPFCGHVTPMDIGPYFHTCPGLEAEQKRKQAEWASAYNGSGKIRKGVITIEYECTDSDMAFDHLMNILQLNQVFTEPGIKDTSTAFFIDPVIEKDIKFHSIHTRKII